MKKNRLFGIGEPVWLRDNKGDIDGIETIEIMDALGFASFREWMHIPWVLEDPSTPKRDVVKRMGEILDKCAELDIEVTGMSHSWFLPEGCVHNNGYYMPDRDLTPDSKYMKTLNMLETSWATLVGQFPQVPMWEVGNEWNIPFLLRDAAVEKFPGSFARDGDFSLDVKADVSVDMMYYAARGIRKANPKAKVVSFSPCPQSEGLPWFVPSQYGIALCLDMLYKRIKSGAFQSENTDDYFDMLAWHPYTSHDAPPDDVWFEINNAAYRVMEKYGDGHKKVLITEFGYSDAGDPEKEKKHAEYYKIIFDYLKRMPYMHAIHVFRLFEDTSANAPGWQPGQWGGPYEQFFGIYREPANGQTPRTKALEIQKMAGSTADLSKFLK